MLLSRNNWRPIFWAAAVVAIIYGMFVYDSFFTKTTAYVYDPASDRFFQISLMASLDTCQRWEPLVPFRRCFPGQITSVDYRGKLHETLRALEEDRALIRTNYKAWVEKQQRETQAQINSMKGNLEFWNITYHATDAVQVSDILPKSLYLLTEFTSGKPPDVFVVDVIITRSNLQNRRPEFEHVRNAVFVRGRAAHKITELTENEL